MLDFVFSISVRFNDFCLNISHIHQTSSVALTLPIHAMTKPLAIAFCTFFFVEMFKSDDSSVEFMTRDQGMSYYLSPIETPYMAIYLIILNHEQVPEETTALCNHSPLSFLPLHFQSHLKPNTIPL